MSLESRIETILTELHSAYRRLLRRSMGASVLSAAAVLLAAIVVLAVLESWFWMDPVVKALLWACGLAAVVVLFRYWRTRYRLNGFTHFYRTTSQELELPGLRYLLDLANEKAGGMGGNRSGAMGVDRADGPVGHSKGSDGMGGLSSAARGVAGTDGTESGTELGGELHRAALEQNLQVVEQASLSERLSSYVHNHVHSRFFRTGSSFFVLSLLLLAITLWVSQDSVIRTGAFWQAYDRPVPFQFMVSPGDTTIEQGSTLALQIDFEGRPPSQIRLGIRSEREEQARLLGMSTLQEHRFAFTPPELYENTEYFVEMDGYRSPIYHIRVERLPRLEDLQITVNPPAYSALPVRTEVYPFNRIDVLAGSLLEIKTRSNKPLSSLSLVARDAGTHTELAADTLIRTEFTAHQSERFRFEMADTHGLQNANPFAFRLNVFDDTPPSVHILSPQPRVQEPVSAMVPLLYEYEDDFGFSALRLHYRLYRAFADEPAAAQVALRVPERRRGLGEYDWNVQDLELSPMDRLEYWLEITDNNTVSGPQSGRSAVHVIEIPSLADRFFEQDSRHEELDERLEQAGETYRQMQERLEQLREEIRQRPDDDWEQAQLLDDIQDQRRSLEEQIQQLRDDFEELTRDLDQQNMMSDETLQRYTELQELMEEIDDPEIMQLLEEMRRNIDMMDQSQLREQLQAIEFNEERYRERLERTLELFRSLRLNADLERMSQMFEELQQQEEELSRREAYSEQEVRLQEEIREQLQQLSERIEAFPERSPERRRSQMETFSEELQQATQALDELLEDNIEQMRQGEADPGDISQQQQEIGRNLGEMAAQLSSMQQDMNQQSIQINLQALRYILQTLLLLSDEQEHIVRRTTDLPANSPGFIDQARRQRMVNSQFEMIADSLYRVSAEIPQFSNRINDRKRDILREMQRATDHLIARDRRNATASERTALGGLNEIGTMLADLIDQLNNLDGDNGGGGMSMQQMLEQMQQTGEDQQALNQQIQDLINDLQGERLTRDNMERLEQMAEQQRQIREQLRRMQRGSGREGERLMSEMEQLAREMEDAINDMRGGSVDQLMVQRQQNILSRMLEMEQSVHERDEDEEQRRGETATDFERSRAQELTMEELRRIIRDGVEQTDYTRFREEYRQLIEQYFRLLEEEISLQPADTQ